MDKKQFLEIGERLKAEKAELEKVARGLREYGRLDEPLDAALTELSTYDNHPGDYGSQLYERSKDFGLLEIIRSQLAEVEQALAALEEGRYGYCQNCARPIAPQRLWAQPRTLFCLHCQKEEEGRRTSPRPVEEEVLRPPFGRTFTAETENAAFHGEDAWEAVARYGTSSSIARNGWKAEDEEEEENGVSRRNRH